MDEGKDVARNMSPGGSTTFFHPSKDLNKNVHSEITSNFECLQKKKIFDGIITTDSWVLKPEIILDIK